MSVEQRVEDGGIVHRLVITDEDGDMLTAKAYPGGALVVAASAGDTGSSILVHVNPDDREALVAFLTGGAS